MNEEAEGPISADEIVSLTEDAGLLRAVSRDIDTVTSQYEMHTRTHSRLREIMSEDTGPIITVSIRKYANSRDGSPVEWTINNKRRCEEIAAVVLESILETIASDRKQIEVNARRLASL